MNSKTEPFPLSRTIELKLLLPVSVRQPGVTWMRGFSSVEYPLVCMEEICIESSVRDAEELSAINEHSPAN